MLCLRILILEATDIEQNGKVLSTVLNYNGHYWEHSKQILKKRRRRKKEKAYKRIMQKPSRILRFQNSFIEKFITKE